ncbi:hypothetical protein AQUCO_01300015v1 [Aquilegia coerulea]|uniref:Uncharacterized protein n=1 Tax=Aquilegia coerulea TaxID=218851 RepID=A0A2G5DZ93_AQUCA|nr:hypothetical protein AQUCO_01300015v1 [Aquilegia coerulea]
MATDTKVSTSNLRFNCKEMQSFHFSDERNKILALLFSITDSRSIFSITDSRSIKVILTLTACHSKLVITYK